MGKQEHRVHRSALCVLAATWLQGKANQHPVQLGWLDLAIWLGLGMCWLLSKEAKNKVA